jgi:hypothetical protein
MNGREPRRWVDRRAVFLLCSAVVSLLLVPVAPEGLEYIGVVLAVWCTVLAIGSWLDKWSRDHS